MSDQISGLQCHTYFRTLGRTEEPVRQSKDIELTPGTKTVENGDFVFTAQMWPAGHETGRASMPFMRASGSIIENVGAA